MNHVFPLCLALVVSLAVPARAADGFAFADTPGKHLDVTAGGRPLVRFMYAYDPATKESLHDTYKPFLHVFAPGGDKLITKGPGGQFTHHRGIFIGWNKIAFNGKSHDRWHMTGGEQVHQKFLRQDAAAGRATFTALIHWNDAEKQAFLVEERTFTVRRVPAGTLIDFSAKLSAPRGDVKLDGDPEHAGVHFRPANELDPKGTVYSFPTEKPDAHKDTDYPWVGETFMLDGAAYSVVEMNHPGNPAGTRWSAYRDYGRFGAFPVAEIKQGGAFTFNYRFLIANGELPGAEVINPLYSEFTGTSAPAAKVTKVPAEQPKPAARKKDGKK
ncbi:MAG: PmoA family protein [Limisphaerales bacterium]